MPQFTVYKNRDARTKATFPLLVDVQSDLLADLQTRVVVPLTDTPALLKKPLSKLTPIVEIDGDEYLLMTPELAGIGRKELGTPVSSLAEQRGVIVGALDFLITGI